VLGVVVLLHAFAALLLWVPFRPRCRPTSADASAATGQSVRGSVMTPSPPETPAPPESPGTTETLTGTAAGQGQVGQERRPGGRAGGSARTKSR
jgi:hypothetical protein